MFFLLFQYVSENRFSEALSAWRNATLLKPTHASAWYNMIILLDNLGRVLGGSVLQVCACFHMSLFFGCFYEENIYIGSTYFKEVPLRNSASQINIAKIEIC